MKLFVLTELIAMFRMEWLKELSKYAEVEIFYLYKKDSDRDLGWFAKEYGQCRVVYLKGPSLPHIGKITCGFIKRLKKSSENDIIIIDGYSNISKLLSIRYLNKLHRRFFVNVDGIVPKNYREKGFRYKLKKKALSSIPYFLCGSKKTNEILEAYGVDKKFIYNHPFTSLHKSDISLQIIGDAEKIALRQKLSINEPHIVISVGRFTYLNGYGKGYDILMLAASKLQKDIGWYIVGGEPTEEFKNLKEQAGLTNVHFIDFKGREELKEYYRASDLFVLMTVGDVWGLVVNEAMACGLPVITTDKCVAGMELVENDKNGYIVSVGDDEGLAYHVKNIIYDDGKLKEMGENALKTIEPYTIENMAKTHMEIFENLKG